MAKENYDKDELLEESEYSRKSEFSKARLCEDHSRRILELRSRDMRPGYTTWFTDKDGNSKPQVIPDSRKEYVGAVEILMRFLSPEIKIEKSKIKDIYEEEKEEVFNKYAYHEKAYKYYDTNKNCALWKLTGEIYLPQKGARILCDDETAPNSVNISSKNGLWDIKVDAYWDALVDLCDQLFEELVDLMHKIDYFKGGSSF